jgi:hypothetical protein
MRRTQIYLEERQQELIRLAALKRGTTASAIIREAVDRYLARDGMTADEKRAKIRALGERFAEQPAFDLPEGQSSAEYVEALRSVSARRLESYRDGANRHDDSD